MRLRPLITFLSLLFLGWTVVLFFAETPVSTGAAVLSSSNTSNTLGFVFLAIAVVLFIAAEPLEHIVLRSQIKKSPGLVRLAQEATRDTDIQKEINRLALKLREGHIESAGLTGASHVEGTDVYYLRGHHGGRLYFRHTSEGYEIVAKSYKDRNQDQVIEKLKVMYPRRHS